MPKFSFLLTIAGLLLAVTLPAQQGVRKYSIGVTMIGPDASCPAAPVFIGSVITGSPAALAGVHSGDELQAINGEAVKNLLDASAQMTAAGSGKVLVKLRRNGADLTFSIPREQSEIIWAHQGLRRLDNGTLVPRDYSDAQIRDYRLMQSDLLRAVQSGDFLNVFPGHYPANLSLYYPGFELFVWDHGQKVIVGGIEDGPAKKNGIRWGDRILSVNGKDPRGQSLGQLEHLFSSSHPATMHLVIARFGTETQVSFPLALASDVLKDSGWKIFEGKKVPLWVPDKYARCFE